MRLISLTILLVLLVHHHHHSAAAKATPARGFFVTSTARPTRDHNEQPNAPLSDFASEVTSSMRLHFSRYSSHKIADNDDDKRLVPTGSNPLHNR